MHRLTLLNPSIIQYKETAKARTSMQRRKQKGNSITLRIDSGKDEPMKDDNETNKSRKSIQKHSTMVTSIRYQINIQGWKLKGDVFCLFNLLVLNSYNFLFLSILLDYMVIIIFSLTYIVFKCMVPCKSVSL